MSNTEQNSSKLCSDCNQFYGNPANENLCSSCFKKKQRTATQAPVAQQPNIQVQQNAVSSPVQQSTDVKMEEEVPQISEVPPKPKQDDHGRCWLCRKKVNLLGVKCNCDFTFCNKHRMPEDHACEYDHAQFGKDLLKQNNPLIQKSKLEKI